MPFVLQTSRRGWCRAILCALAILLSGAACRQPTPRTVPPAAPFTIIMLPDTQHYSRKWPELFMAQTQWVKENRDKENIVFVTHVGDIVNDRKKNRNKLVRCHPQIFLVLCGHRQQTVAYHQVSTNDAGGRVVEILADYQKLPHGGDAWLRLLRIDPAQEEIQVRTYSPALKEFKTDPKNQFKIKLR